MRVQFMPYQLSSCPLITLIKHYYCLFADLNRDQMHITMNWKANFLAVERLFCLMWNNFLTCDTDTIISFISALFPVNHNSSWAPDVLTPYSFRVANIFHLFTSPQSPTPLSSGKRSTHQLQSLLHSEESVTSRMTLTTLNPACVEVKWRHHRLKEEKTFYIISFFVVVVFPGQLIEKEKWQHLKQTNSTLTI